MSDEPRAIIDVRERPDCDEREVMVWLEGFSQFAFAFCIKNIEWVNDAGVGNRRVEKAIEVLRADWRRQHHVR